MPGWKPNLFKEKKSMARYSSSNMLNRQSFVELKVFNVNGVGMRVKWYQKLFLSISDLIFWSDGAFCHDVFLEHMTSSCCAVCLKPWPTKYTAVYVTFEGQN